MTLSPHQDNFSMWIKLNVSGSIFTTTCKTLLKYPDTKLGKLATRSAESSMVVHYFDADEEVFKEVLRFYRTGELHSPSNMCMQSFVTHLNYWGIDESLISSCCRSAEKKDSEMEKEFKWIEGVVQPKCGGDDLSLRENVWYMMSDPAGPYTRWRKASMLWNVFYFVVIIASIVVRAILTVPSTLENTSSLNFTWGPDIFRNLFADPCHTMSSLCEAYKYSFWLTLDVVFCTFFSIEILIRFLCCPDKKYYLLSANTAETIVTLIDDTWILTIILQDTDSEGNCQMLVVITILYTTACNVRCIKLLTMSMKFGPMKVLILSIWSSRKEMGFLVLTLSLCCLIGGPVIYFVELLNGGLTLNTDKISILSIPQGYWYMISTMTTVGYGDYYPITTTGHFVAVFYMVFGIVIMALPIAVIGSNFNSYYKYSLKRKAFI